VSFADPQGAVSDTTIPGLAGDTVVGVGTGGGYVAAGTDRGKVFGWRPGGEVTQLGTMDGAVISLAAFDGNVLALDDTRHARLFSKDGKSFSVSDASLPFGAAMSEDYAVWPQITGTLDVGVMPEGRRYRDLDLYVLSLNTGKVYSLETGTGQQGFPALSGRRLVWQDASGGGDDIRTIELPEGL
jgi:hypothetical protein